MDRKELRKRWIMGTIQPKLFYIPWKDKDEEIYIDVVMEDGEYCTDGEICISFTGWTDYYPAENGNYGHYDNYGSRIFEKNGRYHNPIPKENAAVQPDLRKVNFSVKGAEIKENGINSSYFYLILKGERISISGLPVGSYGVNMNPKTAPMWCAQYFRLYPDYYDGMKSHDRECRFQINKNKKITGLNVDTHFGFGYNESDFYYDKNYPTGYYDIKYVVPTLENNILPVVVDEIEYKVHIKILLQCLKNNRYYTPYNVNEYSERPDYCIGGAYCEIYNKNKLINSGWAVSVINNRISHTTMQCKKHTNIIKCTKPPVFARNKFLTYSDGVIHFKENKEEKVVEITEQDFYNYRDGNEALSYKEAEFKFDAPSVKLELCWMPFPDGVAHITEYNIEGHIKYLDSGNKGLAIKMYVEGEYKGYFMYGFHICGVPLRSHFQKVLRPLYQNGRLGCRFYRNYYIFNAGEPDPTNGSYNIIRMSDHPDAPRVLSPLAELCQETGCALDEYSVIAGNGLYNSDHGDTYIASNAGGHSFTLFSQNDYTTSWDHRNRCPNLGDEFDNILKCKCLNETGGLDLTDHNCQTYYYLGDGLTKEDCGLILSSVWYRQDSIEITHSTGGD